MSDSNDVWHEPDGIEAQCLYNFFEKNGRFADKFFMVWTVFGILGIVGVLVSVIRSVAAEPESAGFMIFSGIAGAGLMYLFFVKLGGYIRNVALKREVNALRNGQMRICTVKALAKTCRVRSSGHGRHCNYYIRVNYPKDGQACDAHVITSHMEFDEINPGDKVVLICYDASFSDNYMRVFSIRRFTEWFDTDS